MDKRHLLLSAASAALLSATLVLAAGAEALAQGATPGFQGTVNNYGVRMNPEENCQKRNIGCSQHFNFHFRADTDGTVHAPFEITNDSLEGFCGSVHIVSRDRAGNPPGNVLLDVRSGTFCIPSKGPDTEYHERVQHIDWTFSANPQLGISGRDLYMVVEDYRNTGINWPDLLSREAGRIIRTIGTVIQIAAALT